MYKAVFSDLDGTLLNSEHKISDYTRDVIKNVVQKGIKFFIATGRRYEEAKIVMETLGLEIPLISSNGVQINDKNGDLLHLNTMNTLDLSTICDINYKKLGQEILFSVVSKNSWFAPEDISTCLIQNGWESEQFPEIETIHNLRQKEAIKCFYMGEHDNLLKLEYEILKKTNNNLNVVFVLPHCLEIFDINSNKYKAMEYVLNLYDLAVSDSLAFGDGYNDYEMLKYAQKGYLMGNSFHRLIKDLPQNEIIGTNDEDAVARKLEELFL